MLPIHVHFISFWNLLVPSPYCSFIAILSSLYHILIMVLFRPMFSCLHPFFSSYTPGQIAIVSPYHGRFPTSFRYITYFHNILWFCPFKNNMKNNNHTSPKFLKQHPPRHNIYIYMMWELKQCSGNFPIGEMSPLGAPRELQVLRSQGLHWSLEQRENRRKKPELP